MFIKLIENDQNILLENRNSTTSSSLSFSHVEHIVDTIEKVPLSIERRLGLIADLPDDFDYLIERATGIKISQNQEDQENL